MILSVVCGTYNRAQYLDEMIETVRRTVPDAIDYEIIVVDNGSTDGTWEYLQAQSDITALQMGKPVGAIKAFTEGAFSAQGKYVLFATDDILFDKYAIMTAIAHLERVLTCGAVAFAHNKRRNKYVVDHQNIRDEDGNIWAYPYPQIALIRRWLGDLCGWWGGRDVMRDAFTYAGDNFLGARIIEYGYSVDEVDGATETERVFEDEPRRMNRERHRHDAQIFYAAYPNHPILRTTPQVDNLDTEQLRILYVNHFTTNKRLRPHHVANKRGLREAFANVGLVWEYDFVQDGKSAPNNLRKIARAWQPHLIFMQVHDASVFSGDALLHVRKEAPHAFMVNRIGDVYEKYHLQSEWKHLDALLIVNGSLIKPCAEMGINAVFWAHSPESVDDVDAVNVEAHDVIFQGNAYSDWRRSLIGTLNSIRANVGLYGGFAGATDTTHYDFTRARALYKHARIAISDQAFDAEAYTSNRFFEIGAAGGALVMHQRTKNLDDALGLKDGEHYISWGSFDELRANIAHWLHADNEIPRQRIVQNMKREIEARHTFDVRVKDLLTQIIPSMEAVNDRQREAHTA